MEKACAGANIKICGEVRAMMLDIIKKREEEDDPTTIRRIIAYILKREAKNYFQKKQSVQMSV